jgi:hypothetical protein
MRHPFKPTRRITPYVGFASLVSVVPWPSPDWGSLLRWYGKGNAHLRLVGETAYRDRSGASVLSDRVIQAPSVGAAGRGRPPQAAARRAGLEDVEKLLTNNISRSGPARRFGLLRCLLGQDRIAELISHRIHEHLVVALAVGDDGSSALRMAHAANDRAFGGRILAAMSHQALHLGDVRHGLDFACAARAGTRGGVTPTTAAMLAAMEACAHAARGDTSPCLRALTDAESAFERSNPSEDPPWIDFDEGGLAGHLARSFRDLNRPQEAEQFAVRSIQLCRPTHLRTRVQRYAILASAHAQQGDLEAACAVGRQALEELSSLRSKRTFDDLARLVEVVSANTNETTDDFISDAREVLKFR